MIAIIPPIHDPSINNKIANISSMIGVKGIGSPGLKQERRIITEIIKAIREPNHPNHPGVIKPIIA